jgi:hypothetical protein
MGGILLANALTIDPIYRATAWRIFRKSVNSFERSPHVDNPVSGSVCLLRLPR